jgi:hypothetical protein
MEEATIALVRMYQRFRFNLEPGQVRPLCGGGREVLDLRQLSILRAQGHHGEVDSAGMPASPSCGLAHLSQRGGQ